MELSYSQESHPSWILELLPKFPWISWNSWKGAKTHPWHPQGAEFGSFSIWENFRRRKTKLSQAPRAENNPKIPPPAKIPEASPVVLPLCFPSPSHLRKLRMENKTFPAPRAALGHHPREFSLLQLLGIPFSCGEKISQAFS